MNAFPNPPGRYAILGARRPRRGKSWRGLETSSRRALPFTHSFPGLPDAPGPRICRYSLYPGAKNTFETVQKSPAPSKLPAAVSSLDGAGPFHLLREITACRPAYAAQAGKILGKLLSKTGESLNGVSGAGHKERAVKGLGLLSFIPGVLTQNQGHRGPLPRLIPALRQPPRPQPWRATQLPVYNSAAFITNRPCRAWRQGRLFWREVVDQ